MLLAPNRWVNVALLLLISPGITISAGPALAALEYSIGLYTARSAASVAFCDVEVAGAGLLSEPKRGCALQTPDSANSAPATIPTVVFAKSNFISFLQKNRCFSSCDPWFVPCGYFLRLDGSAKPALV